MIQRNDEMYRRALESGQLPAAVSATKEINILTGHRVERVFFCPHCGGSQMAGLHLTIVFLFSDS
jgi:hypothetical protein